MELDRFVMKLIGLDELEKSGVVANCRMNRERSLTGPNGYSRDLGFNPLHVLQRQAEGKPRVRWLDLCCGSGMALSEAAEVIHNEGMEARFEIIGVDLVGMFVQPPAESGCLRLLEQSLSTWKPIGRFDLITSVHGLHYIGDKLGLIERAVSWLTDDGHFAANLDLNNLRFGDSRLAGRTVVAELRKSGLQYSARKKLLTCEGHRAKLTRFRFLGADDQAGPNYTRQPAVNSYYERSEVE